MNKYAISVRETLARTVIVEAENTVEAIEKVQGAIEAEKIVLSADDYIEREIKPDNTWKDGEERAVMAKYNTTFREILKRTVLIEADSMEDAVKKIHDSVDAISYEGCEVVSDECWEE